MLTNVSIFKRLMISLSIISNSIVLSQDSLENAQIDLTESERDLLSQGEIIVRDAFTNNDEGKTIEAIGLINANIDAVYSVLLGFEDYPDFMPNITQLEILEKGSNHAILNYTLELPMKKIKKYRLDMFYQKNKNSAQLTWKMIEWPGLKESETINNTTGYWLINNYLEKKGHILVLYHVYTDPGPIPLGLGWIVDILTHNSAPTIVINTRERVYSKSNR
ncbi:MAG: hypothetical protein IIB95_09025 [Candidatus Marinimicrobia bacterium]|nr:hypothetical protein [Candidatus Neomarinimicrobiota bacterium]